jgi:hypothetical protein
MTLPSPCTHALAACACAATLLLTACSSSTPTVAPSSSATAAATATAAPEPFPGNGFRTNIPAGWQDQSTSQTAVASVTGGGTVLMLLASPDHALLVASTTPQPIADDQLSQYLTSIAPSGATQVGQAEPVDIDGDSGVVDTFTVVPATGAAQEIEEMVANQNGDTYEIVLTAAQTDFAQDAGGLQEILDSWTWA